ncbi:MAG: formate/nitrite transporter family protein [Ruminococcaceae bacterium]|nr:formate/nitrite transporter family protein [Oscillospiraceae bacterium]
MKNAFLNSFLAGVFISIGGTVFISLASGGNKLAGAILFAVALLSICILGLFLFTGKVGYIVEDHSKNAILALLCGLGGNFIGATLFGVLLSYALPSVHEFAITMCESKLKLNLLGVLLLAFMCGILMYTAVHIYKSTKSIAGIVFCVPVFILCAFEHSIADMFYFAVARAFTFEYLLFIVIVIVGNALGGMLIPFVQKFVKQ